ncbi:MAG: hypothetical protein R3E04_01455 [Sphingobium sp.]
MPEGDQTTRPIFHIGYHKTATTWFQKSVWPVSLSHAYVPRNKARAALLDEPGLHFDCDRARSLLNMAPDGRPIAVCEENLSGYIHNGGLHGLMAPEVARRIHLLSPDAQIVMFLRNQPDMIRATYAQYVSGGGTYGLKRYLMSHNHVQGALHYPYKAPGFSFAHFEYDRLVAFYDDLFGRENVHVYLFEELREPGFFERMEEDLSARFDHDAINPSAKNRSLGRMGLLLMRGVNLFTRQSVVNKHVIANIPGWHFVRHGVKALIGALPGRGGKLSVGAALSDRIACHYAPSNRRLAKMRDLPLSQHGYPL